MPKITRITQKIFGINAASNQVTAFGTAKEDNPTYTKDPAIIQNANFLNGWNNAIEEDKAPFEEDSNGLYLAVTSQLAYLFQQGISEWDSATAYYTNSLCAVIDNGNLIIKCSVSDNNVGNDPLTDGVNWVDYYSLSMLTNKADIDLSNTVPAQSFINSVKSWINYVPDYSRATSVSYSSGDAVGFDGWLVITLSTAYSNGSASINNQTVATGAGGGNVVEHNTAVVMVKADDIIRFSAYSISFAKIPFIGGSL